MIKSNFHGIAKIKYLIRSYLDSGQLSKVDILSQLNLNLDKRYIEE